MDTLNELVLPADGGSRHDQGSLIFIGNATVLIRRGGFTLLTDPNFVHRHEQVSIGYGLHATRLKDPAMEIGELPPLDLIVLSHFHGDHFDQVAEKDLDKALPIITTPEAKKELEERGFHGARSLETWSSLLVRKGDSRLRITSLPGQHGPLLADLLLPDVMGSMLEFESSEQRTPFRIYITGDTLAIEKLREIPRRFPETHLALLHLGGTKVLGVMVTMDGKQGAEILHMIMPEQAIPIHFDDYDVFKSPLSDFQREAAAAGLESRVHYLERGEEYTFPLSPGEAVATGRQTQLR
jgi:L-ascorbate metabolism protein UlaG (beta-lactamase superfamily)